MSMSAKRPLRTLFVHSDDSESSGFDEEDGIQLGPIPKLPKRSAGGKENAQPREYTIAFIRKQRGDGPDRQYLVRWEGYGKDDDTWEPAEALDECEQLDEWEGKQARRAAEEAEAEAQADLRRESNKRACARHIATYEAMTEAQRSTARRGRKHQTYHDTLTSTTAPYEKLYILPDLHGCYGDCCYRCAMGDPAKECEHLPLRLERRKRLR